MKALLLKDFYMMTKYCRSYLLILVAFFAASFFNNDNLFFLFYPCILCGMIPINLLSYDERSGWLRYSGTLPYKKSQIVGSKYLLSILLEVALLLLTAAVHAIKMNVVGTFDWQEYLFTMLLACIAAFLVCPINMPLMFKFGTEKGRVLYLVMIGVLCGVSVIFPSFAEVAIALSLPLYVLFPVVALVLVGIYALSWYLSVQFLKKREL